MRIKFLFAWYDFWVGIYWDRLHRDLYVLPIPCFGFRIRLAKQRKNASD